MSPIPFSVLDLAPIPENSTAGDALRNSADLARHAERLGYKRYWLAEHHNMPGIASAATAVVIAHVAAATSTIRVGSGGVMVPNHAPLVIAEQFGTLAALHPGRIDLGLGRAPGTDQRTARALRRDMAGSEAKFADDVIELQSYFRPAPPDQAVRAVPGAGLDVPIWLLGSSTYSAELAAALGLPFAFASHFAPDLLLPALQIYRTRFQPSAQLARPYAMLGLNVIAAETDARAAHLFTSLQQAFINLRRGRPGKLPAPAAMQNNWSPMEKAQLDHALVHSIVGAPATISAGLDRFITEFGPDELLITAQIHDHGARRRSYEIVSEIAITRKRCVAA
ncbi:LLM class flavin-dependent oxidoreductase [Acidiphilium sp. PA]|uniref:LLM class flavin-dependent oxidoreductase n=1 Tax=Acidiphilium sp. PA TaxID=2871705 RepID=UPI00224351EB|nr:LLM class flavin-dependent oxidoreductase [Acidiphilium sp. PA]MCW8307248.1 LLM class flavin-dependent oxidoreductase [Acidiphilium sp. PA]